MERTVIVYLCLILISARLGVESRPQETRNSAAGDNQLLAAAYMLEAAESITENNNEDDDDDEKKTDDEMATKRRPLIQASVSQSGSKQLRLKRSLQNPSPPVLPLSVFNQIHSKRISGLNGYQRPNLRQRYLHQRLIHSREAAASDLEPSPPQQTNRQSRMLSRLTQTKS